MKKIINRWDRLFFTKDKEDTPERNAEAIKNVLMAKFKPSEQSEVAITLLFMLKQEREKKIKETEITLLELSEDLIKIDTVLKS